MPVEKFFLNLSLIFSLLVAPAVLLLAYWYRKHLPTGGLVWRRPESVIVSIVTTISIVILLSVAISCFFGIYGHKAPLTLAQSHRYRDVGLMSLLLIAGILLVYAAIRVCFVQIVSEEGIFIQRKVIKIPDFRQRIEWSQIADFYVVSDFPHIHYTFIYKEEELVFKKVVLSVPIAMNALFEKMLHKQLPFVEGDDFIKAVTKKMREGN